MAEKVPRERTWVINSQEIAATQKQRADELLLSIFEGRGAYWRNTRIDANHHWIQKWRKVEINPQDTRFLEESPTPQIRLEEYAEARQTRRSIFRRFSPAEWSEPKYHLVFSKDWPGSLPAAGHAEVTFWYENGNFTGGGDGPLYDELVAAATTPDVPNPEPMDVFAALLTNLNESYHARAEQ